jgi:hypothetical protein
VSSSERACRQRLDLGDDALVAVRAGQALQALVVAVDRRTPASRARSTKLRMRWSRRVPST